tara:strand:+ start:505 stop:915 length:411 start_codon:yes stop_codon:yes gene_type:complete
MKMSIKIGITTAMMLAAGSLWAGQGHSEHEHSGQQKPAGMMMDMSQDMQNMRQTMHRMKQAKNPKEHMQLMKKHSEQMHAMMQKMHGEGGMMKGCMQQMQGMQQMMGQMMGHVQAQQKALDELGSRKRYGPPGKQR